MVLWKREELEEVIRDEKGVVTVEGHVADEGI